MKGEQQFTDEQAQDSSWWTAHWLEGVKNLNLGDYPLICRVERTQAEFPPDPFCKVIDRETVDGPVISFKSKNHSNASLNSSTQVRLAVTLKPLTPLTVTDNASLSTLPPSFTAVTFPCHLEPFIVPFAWGYTRWHSLSMNQKVTSTQQKNDIFRVDSFCAYENMGTMRLDDKASSVRRILDALEHSKSRNAAIEDKLARYKLDLPLIDALIVIDNWYRCTKPFAGNELVLATPMDFSSLLRQTLPLWKSVAVMKNMYDRNKPRVSPWNLAPVAKTSDFVLPWCIAGRNIQLDNSLRLQLEFMFEEFSTKISSSATMDLFYDPVTEDDAPSYGCAVPVGLATSNIVQRLQINPDVGACYYRSVNAVLTDIASIVDCCLLYNNPESDVVAEASKFVMTLKQKISQIVHDHNNNVSNAYKTDDECCLLLHAPLQSRGSILTSTKNPFKGHVYREWLCYNRPTLGSNNGSSIKISVEALQAGDSVTYSRNLHDRFVQGHLSSLDSYQSRLPSTEVVFGMSPGTPGSSQDDWAQATVVWTMPAFPKVSSKRCEKEDKPFHVNTLLQCLGVRFEKSDEVSILFWRPCLLDVDAEFEECALCGLSISESFLRLDKSYSLQGSGAHDAVVPFKMNSIDCCFSVLKKRCLLQTYPSFVDPSLTKEAVMSGCQPLVTKLGKNSPPSFDQLFTMSSRSSTVVEKHHGTRGIALKPKQDNPDVERLVSAGFLPRWISGIDGGTMDAVVLRKMECILPTPKMSLELIQLRLRNGFYRQKSAVVNDIVDSYLSTVVALLFDELSRKKSSISLKKVALLLATLPDVSGEPHAWHFVEKIDEASCLQQLDAVRTLHACALVSVADTSVAEVMFGVVVSPTHSVFEPPYQDPARISARQKLAYLVASTRRDDCLNAFPGLRDEESVPLVKFSIRLAGELILTEDQLRPLIAVVDSTQVNVIVSCEGTSLGREIHREDMCGHNKVASISFTLEDYMRDDSLAKLLFRRPGRSGPCARCQTFKRSMLACRVIRRHSNVDFDWVSAFSDGLGNLTELLSTLGATDALDVSKVDHYDVPVVDNIVKSDKFIEENELTRSDCDYSSINARELVKKAVSALKHADDVLNESAAFSERPIRLSKEFIQRAFPVDPSDGHYLYCVVCGISGDLLCCDGCPNVVHCKCVSLSKLPEGDWFCEECVSSRNPDQPEEPNHMCKQEVTTTTRSGDTTARINNSESRLTLGCESDVSNKTEYVELLLDELRRSRPDQKLKTSADRHAVDGDDEDDDESVKLDEALYPFFGGRQSEPGVSLCSDVLTVTESKDGKGNSWRATRNDGSVYSQGKADVIKGNLIDPGAENLLTQSSGLCAVNERWKSEILSVCSHDSTRRLPSPRKRTPPVRFVNCIDS